jgi:hypothetical protein
VSRSVLRTSAIFVATIGVVGSCVKDHEPLEWAARCSVESSLDAQLCDLEWSPACDHPMDRTIVSLWRDAGIDEAPLVTTPELCRRLAIDLIGRPPTSAEAADCIDLDLNSAVDMWLSHPEYEQEERRYWAGVLGYDTTASVYWRQIHDLDDRVGAMARGEQRYDDFATDVVVHPAIVGLHRDDAWADAVFQIFLGRPARPDEIAGLRPLTGVFHSRQVVDGRYREWIRADCLAHGGEPDRCQEDAEMFRYAEYAVNTCNCQGSFGCSSTALGGLIDLSQIDCAPSDEWVDSLRTLITPSAGQSTRCRDGSNICGDQESRWDEQANRDVNIPATPLQPANDELRAGLRAIGEQLTDRGDFWEAAVDRDLRRFLGWWQDAFKVPEADLPSVRCVLAGILEETGSLNEVRRLILTSRLYATPISRDGQDADTPPWASARLKFLAGERWLRAAAAAVGETIDICDQRLLARQDHDIYWQHVAARALLDDFEVPTQSLDPEYFRPDWPMSIYEGFRLGACRAGGAPTVPNMSIIQAQSGLSESLCAVGSAVVPPAVGDSLDEEAQDLIASHLFVQTLGREPAPVEREAVQEEIDACVAEGACQSPEATARWLCARLLDSSLFTLY